jgi:hypothetical protein
MRTSTILLVAIVSVGATACTGWSTSPSWILVIQTTPNTVQVTGPTVVVAGRSASFSYLVGVGPAGGKSLVINWGDGASSAISLSTPASANQGASAVATFSGAAGHVFATSGSYQVSMILTDASGSSVSSSVDVTVG